LGLHGFFIIRKPILTNKTYTNIYTPLTAADAIRFLLNLETQCELLKVQEKSGIINSDGVRDELEMISQKEKATRERFVMINHVTAEGVPRSISHHEATPSNPKD